MLYVRNIKKSVSWHSKKPNFAEKNLSYKSLQEPLTPRRRKLEKPASSYGLDRLIHCAFIDALEHSNLPSLLELKKHFDIVKLCLSSNIFL